MEKTSKMYRDMANKFNQLAYEAEEIEKIHPLWKAQAEDVKSVLEEMRRVATLESAHFSKISPDDKYPTNEKEADAFIKARIDLWFKTWIVGPIDCLLKDGRWG
ncbi:hypothetical protein C8N40_11171 [Pontibacter mucosus]|uniref:Uncharacterized protein n=1 Tax=Pontibacter mucosus TaxID=1649266 RepID=A0A2T5YD14_9BACT|nr:hypothetical protein [Pontibacter mucosus]PTX14406.1 hypothetical protein C8N40_11171 [Pontibacter mucosus]